MKILVVGGGAREHALGWRLQKDARHVLFFAPGNPGTAMLGTNLKIPADQVSSIVGWAQQEKPELVVIGPELPLSLGLTDRLGVIPVLGPSGAASRLETDKLHAKRLMQQVGIPTAPYRSCLNAMSLRTQLPHVTYPLVLKANGLTGGKGVFIVHDADEAASAVAWLVRHNHDQQIILEELLEGPEVSAMACVHQDQVWPMVGVQDYKRLRNGNHGPNTGGMGATAPAETDAVGWTEQIFGPMSRLMVERGTPYRGVLYAGLIGTRPNQKVLEFNCRFGDPEAQALLPLLHGNVAERFLQVAQGIHPPGAIPSIAGATCVVVLATEGYPDSSEGGGLIEGLDQTDCLIFQGHTRQEGEQLFARGGRVLSVVGQGITPTLAREHAYANVARIRFPGMIYREDIGADHE